MALITRCPVCGTRFKVVPDQLRISDGWVRCGECAEVFDASADLTQSGAEPVLAQPGDGEPLIDPQPVDSFAAAPIVDAGDAGNLGNLGYGTGYVWSAPPVAEPAPDQRFDVPFQPFFERPSMPPADAPELVDEHAAGEVSADDDAVDEPPEVPEVAAQDDAEEVSQSLTEFPADMSTLPEDTVYVAPPPPAEVDAALDEPRPVSFLKEPAETSDALWQRPWVRRSLAALAVLLVLALGGQVALQQRDAIAARLPGTKPVLRALCLPFGCTVQALRQIESVVIDSSTFTTVRHGVYRLNVVLKNRAATEIAVPAIELALTDTQEQAVLRRVLQPADMGTAPGNIAPNAEWTASMELGVAEEASVARIVGYRLLAFYP